jgi:predicted  nucleic acid-binding Zn-ribbon protein
MKHFIEDYRDNQIFYDESNDKFVCEILSEEEVQPKMMKRATLVDVRKSIDDYIKRNSAFKPFKALYSRWSDGSDTKAVTVVAVRKDGGVTIENSKGEREQIISDVKGLRKYSESFLREKAQIDLQIKELESQKEVLKEKLQAITPEKLDLSFINQYK